MEVIHRSENARLITRASADRAGIGDYTIKRDWRREVDQEIRREGYDYFWPDKDGIYTNTPGSQPFPGYPDRVGKITLIHQARRPNGEHALLVGTKETIWRFNGTDNGEYYEGEDANTYFEYDNEEPPNPLAYYVASLHAWEIVGEGFSPNGHRWEALNINGYTVINNGVDLPMTFRLEEGKFIPIYELREQGIVSVGTIGETSGILMCGDITEFADVDTLVEVMNPVGDIDSGSGVASQATTIVTSSTPFFVDTHVGHTIVWEDGRTALITAVASSTPVLTATVLENIATPAPALPFVLRNKAVQTGARFSETITGTVTAGPPNHVLTASAPAFFPADAGPVDVGYYVRFPTGFTATIITYVSSTVVYLDKAPPPLEPVTDLPFWKGDPATAFQIKTDADILTEEMIGRYLIWDSGHVRKIVDVISGTIAVTDTDSHVPFGFVRLDNTSSYKAYTDYSKTNRIQYRCIWATPDEPRRFGAIIPVTMTKGSQKATLPFPAASLVAGQEVVVIGAGEEGGNLTATILSVNGTVMLLSEKALTTVDYGNDPKTDDGYMVQSDMQGSITGYEDLQDDTSGILRILALGENTLIIYKDTCNFTAFFTGNSTAPFDFKRIKIPEAMTLHYRWTLADVGGQFHVYAGANTFYKFDLSSRVPRVILELDVISNLFFKYAALTETDEIYAADNAISNELFFWFPSTGEDKAITFDYKQTSASSTSINMTAAATVKKPVPGTLAGATGDLFVMGTNDGVILVYGRADASQEAWANEREIFYRRSGPPPFMTRSAILEEYDSILRSGWGDFGQSGGAKDLLQYVLHLASESPNCEVRLKIEGARNSADKNPTLYVDELIVSPETENQVATFFRDNFFRWTLTISGKNNPCRIVQHAFDVDLVASENHERRVTADAVTVP